MMAQRWCEVDTELFTETCGLKEIQGGGSYVGNIADTEITALSEGTGFTIRKCKVMIREDKSG